MARQTAGEIKLYEHRPNGETVWIDVEDNHLLYIAVIDDQPYEIVQMNSHLSRPLRTGIYLAEYGTWASGYNFPCWSDFTDAYCVRVNVPAHIAKLVESAADPFAWDFIRFVDGGQWSSWKSIKLEEDNSNDESSHHR